MKVKINIPLVFSIFALVCSLITGCGGTNNIPDVSSVPLRIGWSLWPGWYPLILADEMGFFEKNGVEVEILQYDYADSIAEFNSGSLDGAFLGNFDALHSANDSKIVYITDNSNGAEGFVASSGISSPADLKGKKVGIIFGSVSEIFVTVMLDAYGLTRSDVTLVSIPPENVPGAIPDQIVAGHTWEPYLSDALLQGYHLLYSSADTPGLIPDVIVFRKLVTENRPDDIRAFILAWTEAVEYWQNNPSEANELIANRLGINPEEISTEGIKIFTLEDNRTAFTQGDDFTSLYFSTEYNLDFLIKTGSLTRKPDIDEFLDSSFLP